MRDRLLALSLLAFAFAASAAEIPLEDFARHAQFRDIKISPDGDYIGPDRFCYTVSDQHGGFDSACVDVWIGDRDHDVPIEIVDPKHVFHIRLDS